MSTDTQAKAPPSYRIYSVSKKDEEQSTWQEIGAAWKHKDGKGFSLQFTARPLDDAKLVLREPKAKKTEHA